MRGSRLGPRNIHFLKTVAEAYKASKTEGTEKQAWAILVSHTRGACVPGSIYPPAQQPSQMSGPQKRLFSVSRVTNVGRGVISCVVNSQVAKPSQVVFLKGCFSHALLVLVLTEGHSRDLGSALQEGGLRPTNPRKSRF